MPLPEFFRPPTRVWPNIDWLIIGSGLGLTLIGILTIWGASGGESGPGPFAGYPRRQTIRLLVGLTAMIALIAIHPRWSKTFAWPLYALLVVALIVLLVQGRRINGAVSWFLIPLGPIRFNLQPSELGKVIVVVALARYLSSRMNTFRRLHHTIVPLIIVAVPMGLIYLQPDLGTAIVFLPVAFVMFYVAGIRKRVLAAYAVLGVVAALAAYPHLQPYQKGRIQTFLNPGEDDLGKGWNVIQAQAALGSGGFFGKGWGRGTQTSFRFLPEYHTDFVFPTFGEQFGLSGCLSVLALYGLLLARSWLVAGRSSDLYGTLLVSGLATVWAIHIVLNIGMATGLLPVTGLPLPFFSYGGSFILTCYIMIGLIVSVGARRGA